MKAATWQNSDFRDAKLCARCAFGLRTDMRTTYTIESMRVRELPGCSSPFDSLEAGASSANGANLC